MGNVVLRHLLKAGHALDVVMTEDDARSRIRAWMDAKMKGVSPLLEGYDGHQNRYWAIEGGEVQAMLTMPVQQAQHANQGQTNYGGGYPNPSGI